MFEHTIPVEDKLPRRLRVLHYHYIWCFNFRKHYI
jgi:hypothetical protein